MCGIYITNLTYTKPQVVEKLEKIQYRGPDHLAVSTIKDVTIGHLRLAIVDLDQRSNQPFSYKHLHITYNGEIYNFLEIKKELVKLGYHFTTNSDTEVLIVGYYEWGEKVLDKLNGMFAFAIYDEIKNEIFCARDRLGVKPFYYFWENGYFEICSQLKPLMDVSREISEKAISIFLECGYIPSPYSMLENVYKLPPGSILNIDLNNKTKEVKKYWDLQPVKKLNISYQEAKDQLHSLIKDAVKIRMFSDVPFGSFLSGGVDSALVTAIAAKLSHQKLNTFTIGFDHDSYDESQVAKKYATIIDSNHRETLCEISDVQKMIPIMAKIYDEPFADSSAIPSLLLNSVTKKYATVALSGDGGDESFLGYNHFDSVYYYQFVKKIPFFIRKLIAKIFPIKRITDIILINNMHEYIVKRFLGYDSLLLKKDNSWLDHYKDFDRLSQNRLQKTADLNIKLWLENDSNVKVDRASMAASVEVRSPFLDYRIIEFARRLPVSYRYKRKEKKRILKDILEEYIPREIFNLPKKGFAIPLADWLRGDLKNDIISTLNDDFLKSVPNMDVSKLKIKMINHFNLSEDNTIDIWKVYVLALWYKEFNQK